MKKSKKKNKTCEYIQAIFGIGPAEMADSWIDWREARITDEHILDKFQVLKQNPNKKKLSEKISVVEV